MHVMLHLENECFFLSYKFDNLGFTREELICTRIYSIHMCTADDDDFVQTYNMYNCNLISNRACDKIFRLDIISNAKYKKCS